MMKLSDEHRAVVTMFHILVMPHADISKILRVAESSLKIYQQPETARVALQNPPALSVPASAEGEWSLTSPVATQIFRTQPVCRFNESAQTHQAAAPPRYVLDSVPVSYEPTFSF